MDLRKLKSLIDLVSDSDITELEISEGDDSVRIVKAKTRSGEKIVKYEKPANSESLITTLNQNQKVLKLKILKQ